MARTPESTVKVISMSGNVRSEVHSDGYASAGLAEIRLRAV